jgi:hypothetical protein
VFQRGGRPYSADTSPEAKIPEVPACLVAAAVFKTISASNVFAVKNAELPMFYGVKRTSGDSRQDPIKPRKTSFAGVSDTRRIPIWSLHDFELWDMIL